jgi:hypothetical protein
MRSEAKAHTRGSRGIRRRCYAERMDKEEVVLGLDDLSQWAEEYSEERREEKERAESEVLRRGEGKAQRGTGAT